MRRSLIRTARRVRADVRPLSEGARRAFLVLPADDRAAAHDLRHAIRTANLGIPGMPRTVWTTCATVQVL